MIERVILSELEHYKTFIESPEYDEVYKWEALKTFQDNWNVDAEDFKTMYEKSFQTKNSGNLWGGPNWFPKTVMIKFIEFDTEKVREMFKDLFNETLGVDNRVSRFVYGCDQLLVDLNEDAVQHHYHDGQRMISLYMSFRYPENYGIYKFTEFKKFMELVKAKTVPKTGECERFFKIARLLYSKYISSNEELQAVHKAKLNENCYQGPSIMLAQDFIFRTAKRYMS